MKPRLHCARLALFLCGCAAFLNLYATQSILQTLAANFEVSAKAAGWSITVTTLAVALTAPFVSRLTGRFEQRTVISAAALLLALPALMTAYASSFAELLVWRFIEGMLIPVVFATSVAYIGDRWRGGTVTEVTSLYVAGTVLGGFAGRFVTGVMTEYVGWREAFELLAVLSLMVGGFIQFLLPDNPPRVARPATTWSDVLGTPLLAAYAVGFCVLFSQVATFTYAGLYLSQAPFDLGPAALGTIYMVFLLALVVIPIAGRLSRSRPQSELLTAAAVLGVCGSGLTLLPSLWCIVLGLALSSTGVFLAQAAASAFTTATARHNKAGAVGLYLTCYYLGGSFGAIVPALIWGRWGWTGCVALIIGFQLLSLLIALTGWKPLQPELSKTS
ncbi:MFS transporter [Pseudomonas sp. CBSPBW29]|jgi:predicted MFS family arabinose efflux permease|uniref:MFS transporter n=1 Tax=Pseudomonas TaxID=286 RepID=UPI0021AD36B0|nr:MULTISPECIES: MFS transporter [unclassified Pseudomonas]WEL45050.1 MFS transporter [Pseudomonas sp. CBSPBW29]WEL66155.1 MFS transporter [Pseudomonas sp. CBSPGW29]WEL69625.1 MFS transporter [Pseudomonas sp. CBSPCGW29]WEL76601.1 MFS transporter [Pseudomonas sp. CBSPAW29]WEL84799.1 MFS transporter [Pseudomonas sp. CBSPCAW29]